MQNARVEASSEPLDARILGELERGPQTTRVLAQTLKVPPDVVEARCLALRATHDLRRNVVRERDVQLLRGIHEAAHTTSELAESLHLPPPRAYAACRRLERVGLVSSTLEPSPRRLLFFPATGQVLSHSNRDDLQEVMGNLRAIGRRVIAAHGVPRGAQLPERVKSELRREYRGYLAALAARVDTPRERERVRAFTAQFMAVLGGTRARDVMAMTGARLLRPKLRRWAVALVTASLLGGGGVLPGEVVWGALDPPASPAKPRRPARGTRTRVPLSSSVVHRGEGAQHDIEPTVSAPPPERSQP